MASFTTVLVPALEKKKKKQSYEEQKPSQKSGHAEGVPSLWKSQWNYVTQVVVQK